MAVPIADDNLLHENKFHQKGGNVMFRKFFSLMFLASVILFSGQAIDTPRIEALNYGNDGSRYEVINDYYVFSDNGIEYYVIYVVYAPYSDFFTVYLKDVKNGEQINHSEYYFNGGNVCELISNTLGSEKGYVSSDSRARTIYNLVVSGKLKEAERDLEAEMAKENMEKAAKPWVKSGTHYYYLKQYERAIQDYNKAIQLNPNYAVAYNNRGNAYSDLRKYERAIQDFDKAIELKPNYEYAYYWRGWVYEKMKEYKKALEDYNKALKFDPNNKDAKKGIKRLSKRLSKME